MTKEEVQKIIDELPHPGVLLLLERKGDITLHANGKLLGYVSRYIYTDFDWMPIKCNDKFNLHRLDFKTNCYECQNRGMVAGSAHSSCKAWDFADILTATDMPQGDPHAIKSGWWFFPVNFDPIWMRSMCIKFNNGKNTKSD